MTMTDDHTPKKPDTSAVAPAEALTRPSLRPGKLPALVLGAATLTPSTLADLMDRTEDRHGFMDRSRAAYHSAACTLAAHGLLDVAGTAPGQGGAALYVLTPAGEQELNRLWAQQQGAA